VTLDLLDRKGKYENGFMHGPVPAFRRRGEWQPAEIGFTANALPGSPGAGYRAAQTLFHEGGHAAHYSNIVMDAPCFSQEYAPSSVALSETQAMFCDRVLSDPDWQTLYARNAAGTPVPLDLMEEGIRETQPHAAYAVRNLMTVCYAEKALYEMPEQDLSADRVLRAFREEEARLTLLPEGCPRPTLAVPHLLARESSGYYHGYVLAQMAVFQTREHFLEKHGRITDNPEIGAELSRSYWEPGNSRGFLELVETLTGKPLSADALIAEVSRDVADATERARGAVQRAERMTPSAEPPDLDLRLRVIHGTETVVEETEDPLQAAAGFRAWLRERRNEPAAAQS
jgi:Zn-dependent oligopeptidase